MKNMKKFLALALALVMILAMATTASAAGTDSITVSKAVDGETYELYKLFDLVVDSATDPKAYTYTINSAWKAFFAEGAPGAAYITVNEAGAVTIANEETAAALAKAAAAWDDKPAALATKVAAGGSVVFDGLDHGYWLITSSLGTKAMTETTPDKEAVEVKEKNPTDTIKKEVKEDNGGTYGAKNNAQIGDVVEFKSVTTLYPATRNVKIHDTMTDGLTFTAGSIQIFTDEDLAKPLDTANYEIQANPDDGDTFTIQIKDTYIATLTAETKLYMTYTATLNEKAVEVGEDGTVALDSQTNTAKVSYGNKQSVDSTTITESNKFSVFKHAKDATNNLAGAVFEVKKDGVALKLVKIDDNNYRIADADDTVTTDTFITVANGDIVIWGVDAEDKYTLKETAAPAGYNLLPNEIEVTVDAANSTRVDVVNQTGTELPFTGGMGTTLFYIVGGALALAAVVLLVTKKRMASAE